MWSLTLGRCVWSLTTSFEEKETIHRVLKACGTTRKAWILEQAHGSPDVGAHFVLRKNPLLGKAWGEYRRTLVLPKSPNQPVFATRRAYEFFDLDRSGVLAIRTRNFGAWANFFVGLGLLLTFLGLVAALMAAGTGIAAENVKDMRDALKAVIDAASLKFWTSIFGLGCSLLLALFHRTCAHAIEGWYHDFCHYMDAATVTLTAEAVALEQKGQIEDLAVHMKGVSDTIAFTIGQELEKALNNTLPGHLSSAMEPVGQSISTMADRLGSANERALGDLANQFSESMTGAARGELAALGKSLEMVGSTLDALSTKLSANGQEVSQEILGAAHELRAVGMTVTSGMQIIIDTSQGQAQKIGEILQEKVSSAGVAAGEAATEAAKALTAAVDEIRTALQQGAQGMTGEVQQSSQRWPKALPRLSPNLNVAPPRPEPNFGRKPPLPVLKPRI